MSTLLLVLLGLFRLCVYYCCATCVEYVHVTLAFVVVLLQLKREPRPFPTLDIVRQVTDIDRFKYEDFKLNGYNPLPKIKMDMAV